MGQGQGYETRDNTGTLFKNDRRDKDSHPNAKGKALIGGQWYWVSAWTKQGKAGAFQSLAFELMSEEHVAKYVNGGGRNGGQQRGGYGNNRGGSGSRPAPARRGGSDDYDANPFDDGDPF